MAVAEIRQGDALALLRDLPSGSVDAVITDPPFKLSQTYSAGVDADNLLAVSSLWPVAGEMFRVVRPGGFCALFYDNRILPLAIEVMRQTGWQYLRGLTLYRRWGQASLLAGWMSTSDFVLVYTRPGAKYGFHGSEVRHDVYVKSSPESEHTGHPAQKPLDPVRHLVSRLSPPGGTVVDPYSGSCTTGVAAVMERRNFIGSDLSEHWVEVGRSRLSAAAQGYKDDGAQLVMGIEEGAA